MSGKYNTSVYNYRKLSLLSIPTIKNVAFCLRPSKEGLGMKSLDIIYFSFFLAFFPLCLTALRRWGVRWLAAGKCKERRR